MRNEGLAIHPNLADQAMTEYATPRFARDELERWANWYRWCQVHEIGVRFLALLQRPAAIAAALAEIRALPLEPPEALALTPVERHLARVILRRELGRGDAVCIGCGCSDTYGCRTLAGVGCAWIACDRLAGLGVCSICRPALADFWRDKSRRARNLHYRQALGIL